MENNRITQPSAKSVLFAKFARDMAEGPLCEDGARATNHFMKFFFGDDWRSHPEQAAIVKFGVTMFEVGIALALMDVESGVINLTLITRREPGGSEDQS